MRKQERRNNYNFVLRLEEGDNSASLFSAFRSFLPTPSLQPALPCAPKGASKEVGRTVRPTVQDEGT